MTNAELQRRYFQWMYDVVYGEDYKHNVEFRKMFRMLDGIEFTYTLPLDENRAKDGIELRYRFGYEHGYSNDLIESALDIRPCSVLEMMVALAMRCEEDIMCVPDLGNRTGEWFWDMIASLGIGHMNDKIYDRHFIEQQIELFLNRDYSPNGRGGLFHIPDIKDDLRKVEIWYQAMWYLDWVIETE